MVPPASSPAGPAPTRNLMTQSASSSSHHDMKLHKSPRREAKSRKNFWNTEKEKKDKDKDEKAKKEDHKEKDKEEWTTKKDEKKEDMLIIVKAEKKAGRSGDRKNKSMRSRGKAEKDSASSRMMADEPPIDQIKECQGEYESLSKTVLSRKRSDLVPETGTSEKSQYEENCLCFEDSVSEAKGRQRRSSSPRLTPPPLGYLLDCVCLNKTLTNPNISEINKWKQVNHAHLHAIQAVWEDSQHLYAIREPLEEAAFSFTLSESQIITILSSVLEGLEALHSNSVLHLQLELSSILCDDNNNYVLSKDFHCSDLPAIYLPPKERENSVLADLWSVAVVAFYLLFKTFENVSSRDGSSFIKELPKRQDAPKVANLINMIITNHASTATVCLNLLK
uniref:Protein kinase domain-containing protein n=1 Tax=Arcella intermedia TaxID=1963864 RepID=A0A6B2L5Q0_9EUKA